MYMYSCDGKSKSASDNVQSHCCRKIHVHIAQHIRRTEQRHARHTVLINVHHEGPSNSNKYRTHRSLARTGMADCSPMTAISQWLIAVTRLQSAIPVLTGMPQSLRTRRGPLYMSSSLPRLIHCTNLR